MGDKLNKTIRSGIAVLVGSGILYGVYVWAKNGNSPINIIIGSILVAAVVISVIRMSKEKWPFNNFKNDWQTLGVWLLIGVLAVLSLMFFAGFGGFAD